MIASIMVGKAPLFGMEYTIELHGQQIRIIALPNPARWPLLIVGVVLVMGACWAFVVQAWFAGVCLLLVVPALAAGYALLQHLYVANQRLIPDIERRLSTCHTQRSLAIVHAWTQIYDKAPTASFLHVPVGTTAEQLEEFMVRDFTPDVLLLMLETRASVARKIAQHLGCPYAELPGTIDLDEAR